MYQNHIFFQPYPFFPYAYRQHPGSMGPQPGTPGSTPVWWQWYTAGPLGVPRPRPRPRPPHVVYHLPAGHGVHPVPYPQTGIQPGVGPGYILIGPPHY